MFSGRCGRTNCALFSTMFGIAWGIVSIVLMVAAGEGLRKGQEATGCSTLGKDVMIIFHGRTSLQAGGTRAWDGRALARRRCCGSAIRSDGLSIHASRNWSRIRSAFTRNYNNAAFPGDRILSGVRLHSQPRCWRRADFTTGMICGSCVE